MRTRALGLAGVLALPILVLAAPAAAHRLATKAEHTSIVSAIRKQDWGSGLNYNWVAVHRCNTEKLYISTVDPHWAGLLFRSKYKSTDPRYLACGQQGGNKEGVWTAQRSGKTWKSTGWILGDRGGFCGELTAAGIPVPVFKDIAGFAFACT